MHPGRPRPAPSDDSGGHQPPAVADPRPSPTPPPDAPVGWQPDWTDDQAAAARIVDAYRDFSIKTCSDPLGVPGQGWSDVAIEPEREHAFGVHVRLVIDQQHTAGTIKVENRVVGSEQPTDDGGRAILVTQCEDSTDMVLLDANDDWVPDVPNGEVDRTINNYSVSWVPEVNDWRVAVRHWGASC
jgi:hypothetical protein